MVLKILRALKVLKLIMDPMDPMGHAVTTVIMVEEAWLVAFPLILE
jgi:hypothetical protein